MKRATIPGGSEARLIPSRRVFLAAAAALCASRVIAQSSQKVRRIGFLSYAVPLTPAQEEFTWKPLRSRGWQEGKNIVIERRYASGRSELLQAMAEELVRQKVEIIVGHGTAASLAAKKATSTIPIVIHRSGDPVATGLVKSLSRPGGNITGTSTITPELDVKRLEVVRELLPRARSVCEFVNSLNPLYAAIRKDKEALYRSFQLTPAFIDATRADQLENAVAEAKRQGCEALILPTESLYGQNMPAIVAAARRASIPVMVGEMSMGHDGVLLAYGAREQEYVDNLADFIDQILKGAKPGDLPIRQPTKFEMGIDLAAAKALDITVPQSLVLRADYVGR